MLNFIVKYWVEFALGLVAACIVYAIKKYYESQSKINKQDQDTFKKEIIQTINQDLENQVTRSDNADRKIEGMVKDLSTSVKILGDGVTSIQNQMKVDNVQAVKSGVLSIQGKAFKADCRRLLEKDHVITEEEWDDIKMDHDSYHALGGNHIGDTLFDSVTEKWKKQLNDQKS